MVCKIIIIIDVKCVVLTVHFFYLLLEKMFLWILKAVNLLKMPQIL